MIFSKLMMQVLFVALFVALTLYYHHQSNRNETCKSEWSVDGVSPGNLKSEVFQLGWRLVEEAQLSNDSLTFQTQGVFPLVTYFDQYDKVCAVWGGSLEGPEGRFQSLEPVQNVIDAMGNPDSNEIAALIYYRAGLEIKVDHREGQIGTFYVKPLKLSPSQE